MIEALFLLCGTLIVAHHVVYPWVMARAAFGTRLEASAAKEQLRSVTLIVPAFNEAELIQAKLQNIAELGYSRDALHVIIGLDGCTDSTAERIHAWRAAHAAPWLTVHGFPFNRGKTALLNELISACTSDVVALSDASTFLVPDALQLAVSHFDDDAVGFVTGRYVLDAKTAPGERAYWAYQTKIKAGEATFGSPMGAHGAFYAFRRSDWEPLEADTINDDFILPMRIVARGRRGIYDTRIALYERQKNGIQSDFRRRMRIGAGNLQQVARTWRLFDPRRLGLAFTFLFGKALRVAMPYFMIAAVVSNVILATHHGGVWAAALILHLMAYGLAILGLALGERAPALCASSGYLVAGHAAGFIGGLQYLCWDQRPGWSARHREDRPSDYAPPLTRMGKRVFDIVCALGALVVLAVVFVPIALAIKLESRGPIFYRQLRVGRATPRATQLFWLIKFRTMRVDAEKSTGAVWATKNDPRVTRVGRFLRKTRLDELPQAWNVLVGEMSVVGPRPERPQFFEKLETEIPFYIERTFGLKPGITGLAQVSQGYDESLEDVRSKVLFDHAYAVLISRPLRWLVTDVSIVLRTVSTMVLGKGQ